MKVVIESSKRIIKSWIWSVTNRVRKEKVVMSATKDNFLQVWWDEWEEAVENDHEQDDVVIHSEKGHRNLLVGKLVICFGT